MITPTGLAALWIIFEAIALIGAGMLVEMTQLDTTREEAFYYGFTAILIGMVIGWQNGSFLIGDWRLPIVSAGLFIMGYCIAAGLASIFPKKYWLARNNLKATLYPAMALAFSLLILFTVTDPVQAALSGAGLSLFSYLFYRVVAEHLSHSKPDWIRALTIGIIVTISVEVGALCLVSALVH